MRCGCHHISVGSHRIAPYRNSLSSIHEHDHNEEAETIRSISILASIPFLFSLFVLHGLHLISKVTIACLSHKIIEIMAWGDQSNDV